MSSPQPICPLCRDPLTELPEWSPPPNLTHAAVRSLYALQVGDVQLLCGHAMCLGCAQEWVYRNEGLDVEGERGRVWCPSCRMEGGVEIVG